jgi:hypothetical protein
MAILALALKLSILVSREARIPEQTVSVNSAVP